MTDPKEIFRDGLPAHNPALLVLESHGYRLGIHPPTYDAGEEKNHDDIGFWFAVKGNQEFIASDPLSLLGLVSIWESRGNDWPRSLRGRTSATANAPGRYVFIEHFRCV